MLRSFVTKNRYHHSHSWRGKVEGEKKKKKKKKKETEKKRKKGGGKKK